MATTEKELERQAALPAGAVQRRFADTELPADDVGQKATITPEAHAAFLQRLLAQGVISSIPEGRLGPPPRPIPVRGEPVSQTIIKDRG